MHWFIRLTTAIFLTIISIILLFSAAFAYLIVTPLGGKILVRCLKQQFSSAALIHIGHYEGSLHNGFVLTNISIKGESYLPDALISIQQIQVRLPLWDWRRSDLRIFNARIAIPDSDPVVFTGRVHGGQIIGNLYGNSVDIHEAIRFWANEDIKKNLQGFISNIDVTIQGPVFSPRVSGPFMADGIRYKSVLLTNCISKVELTLFPDLGQIHLKGNVNVYSGNVKVQNVELELSQSKFNYQGDFFNPDLDIHLGAKVEDMDFHLAIEGALANPQLSVSSDPPMAPQEALRVLFTGNAWSSSTSPFNGVTSSELAENFLDYSLKDINDNQQLGLKTKLTDNLKLGVEMDQLPSIPGATNIYYSHKINGELDLSEHTSFNISQEVLPQDNYPSTSYQDAQPEAETEFYLQYKKRF